MGTGRAWSTSDSSLKFNSCLPHALCITSTSSCSSKPHAVSNWPTKFKEQTKQKINKPPPPTSSLLWSLETEINSARVWIIFFYMSVLYWLIYLHNLLNVWFFWCLLRDQTCVFWWVWVETLTSTRQRFSVLEMWPLQK